MGAGGGVVTAGVGTAAGAGAGVMGGGGPREEPGAEPGCGAVAGLAEGILCTGAAVGFAGFVAGAGSIGGGGPDPVRDGGWSLADVAEPVSPTAVTRGSSSRGFRPTIDSFWFKVADEPSPWDRSAGATWSATSPSGWGGA